MSELERQVRTALRRRGAAVTPALLRPEAGRFPARPPRRPWLAPVAAALSILVVVLIALVVSRAGSSGDKAGSGRSAAAMLAGTDWRLTEVRYPDGRRVAVSDRVGADIAFESDGKRLDGSDGVNTISAGYSVTGADSLTTGPATASAVGYVGHNPAKLAAIAGYAAVLESRSDVAVDVDGHRLQLSAKGFTVTFTGSAPVATSSQPRPAGSS